MGSLGHVAGRGLCEWLTWKKCQALHALLEVFKAKFTQSVDIFKAKFTLKCHEFKNLFKKCPQIP